MIEKQGSKIIEKDNTIKKQENKIEINEEETSWLRSIISNPFF